jgi:hypothetical protein
MLLQLVLVVVWFSLGDLEKTLNVLSQTRITFLHGVSHIIPNPFGFSPMYMVPLIGVKDRLSGTLLLLLEIALKPLGYALGIFNSILF